MNQGYVTGTLYTGMEWVTRIVYINALWIVFTLLGGVLFGFSPATAALFSIVRKWTDGEEVTQLFSEFWKEYRQLFWKSQKIGLLLMVIGLLLIVDFQFFLQGNSTIGWLGKMITIQLIFLYAVMLMYIFPLYIDTKQQISNVFKEAFRLFLQAPFKTIFGLFSMMALGLLFVTVPAVALLCGASSIAMWQVFYTEKYVLKHKVA